MKPILHQAIHLPLKPFYLMLGCIVVISIASCLILFVLPLVLAFKLVMILCVILSSIYFGLRDALLILPSSWQLLTIDVKGQLTITNKRNQSFNPDLANSSFIHKRLILLNFKRERLKLALPPMISFTQLENTNAQRRLRVWLRWGKPSKHDNKARHQEDLLEARD